MFYDFRRDGVPYFVLRIPYGGGEGFWAGTDIESTSDKVRD
jgi:hypothetical protein